MNQLKVTGSEGLPLASRLRAALGQKTTHTDPAKTCLLLDLSGSMDGLIGPGRTKLSELRNLAAQFPDIRTFVFASTCHELPKGNPIPGTFGGTAMGPAFVTVKQSGIDHVVMITDGEPDSESQAINASQGLTIDCFYVGPDPAPDFLKMLCTHTKGQYGKATLADVTALTSAVKERLQIGAPKSVVL